ncbi:alpha/beta hydrolase [Williamsia sp. M5A3_1d]
MVLGEGLGGIKEMSLDLVGSAFAEAGVAAVAFDYPNFGDSEGPRRQLVDPAAQIEAYRGAVAFALASEVVSSHRIALWGASFGGGHVLRVASLRGCHAACAVAVVPFVGVPIVRTALGSVRPSALRRALQSTIPIVGPTGGTAALMNSDEGYEALVNTMAVRAPRWRNEIDSGSMSRVLRYRPLPSGARPSIPTRVIVATDDIVNPPGRVRESVQGADLVEISGRHFDIYGSTFEPMMAASIAWIRHHTAEVS